MCISVYWLCSVGTIDEFPDLDQKDIASEDVPSIGWIAIPTESEAFQPHKDKTSDRVMDCKENFFFLFCG